MSLVFDQPGRQSAMPSGKQIAEKQTELATLNAQIEEKKKQYGMLQSFHTKVATALYEADKAKIIELQKEERDAVMAILHAEKVKQEITDDLDRLEEIRGDIKASEALLDTTSTRLKAAQEEETLVRRKLDTQLGNKADELERVTKQVDDLLITRKEAKRDVTKAKKQEQSILQKLNERESSLNRKERFLVRKARDLATYEKRMREFWKAETGKDFPMKFA